MYDERRLEQRVMVARPYGIALVRLPRRRTENMQRADRGLNALSWIPMAPEAG